MEHRYYFYNHPICRKSEIDWGCRTAKSVPQVKTGRLHFKYDKPASEKQLAFVRNLVHSAKNYIANADRIAKEIEEAPIEVRPSMRRIYIDELDREIIEVLSVPDDLTSWEASGIISALRDCSSSSYIAQRVADAINGRQSERITNGNTTLSLLAFQDAVKVMVKRI